MVSMPKFSLGKELSIPYRPWVYFFIFLAANILLSYFSISLELKLWIGLVGLVLPFGLALHQLPSKPNSKTLLQKDFLPPIPFWAWILLGAAAVFVRFYKLTTLSVWPHFDEGFWGYSAIHFYRDWGWHLFYNNNPIPPAYLWELGLFFKWFKPSLFTLWLLPALFSLLTLPLGYLAARQFFTRSFAVLLFLLLAFSFGPLFLARFCSQLNFLILLECLFFLLLGWFLKAPDSRSLNLRAVVLGLAAGAGFYIYISWVMVAVMFSLAVLAFLWKSRRPNVVPAFLFGGTALLVLLPLLWAGLWNSLLRFEKILSVFHHTSDPLEQLSVSLSYIGVIFWGMDPEVYTYQPIWGGFLNPLLDALFFIGFLEIWRNRRHSLFRWVVLALGIWMLPAMLTHTREPFRIISVLPLLLVVCAWGWQRLLEELPSRKAWMAVALLGLAFAGLDFYHLAVKYHQIWSRESAWRGYAKSIERYRAHFLLDQMAKEKGTGLVFADFFPGLADQTLMITDDGYNAVLNPTLPFDSATWAAVLSNVNEEPFLKNRFPQGKAVWLSSGLTCPDGGLILWTMPVNPENRESLRGWKKASDAFQAAPGVSEEDLLRGLLSAYPAYQGDPFLESCFLEKEADLVYRISGFKDYQKPIELLNRAIQRGYPSAHLYLKLGSFYMMSGDSPAARRAFEKALKAPLDRTQARQYLTLMPIKKKRTP
jgi:tetratricopeptide (TPR) repeat protein